MNEFHPRFGSLSGGAVAALVGIFGYLVFPYLFLTGLLGLIDGIGSVDGGEWKMLIEDWRSLVLMLSIPLIGLAFLRGFYWRGSYSRLSFALIMVAIFAYLVWSLQLDGRVQAALDVEDLELQVSAFIYFFLGFVALWGLFNLGEFLDQRKDFIRRYNEKMNLPAPAPEPYEDPKDHTWMHDFRLRYGRWATGFRTARRYYGRFMVWPILFFMVVTAGLLKANELVPIEMQNQLEDAILLLFWTGLVVVILSFLKGFYPKGSVPRMGFWVAMVTVLCLWMWIFLFGGSLAVEIADVAEFSIGFTPIVLLLIFATALWGVYAVVELWSYRKDWKKNGFKPVTK